MNILTLDFKYLIHGEVHATLVGTHFPKSFELRGLDCKDEDFFFDVQKSDNPFSFKYSLKSRFDNFMGSHIDHPINYPFFNKNEAFISSGFLPITDIPYILEYKNIPENWKIFSTISDGEIVSPEKMEQFFIYLSNELEITSIKGHNFVIGKNVHLPFSLFELHNFIEKSSKIHEHFFGPTITNDGLLILLLQSPKNFKELANHKTFSTGENYTGSGIAIFGPNLPENYLKYGHPSYKDFIFGGIHHEIGHRYTSAGPARLKSILYASDNCNKEVRNIIGEGLNIYFNNATRALIDSDVIFNQNVFFENLIQKIKNGKRSLLVDLFLFDGNLRLEINKNLYEVFKEMIKVKINDRSPFESLDFIFEVAERISGKKLSDKTKSFLSNPNIEEYEINFELVKGLFNGSDFLFFISRN